MENGKKYTSIGILEETKALLDKETPKAYTYDEMVLALLQLWKNKKDSGVKTGKPPQDS